MTILTEWYEKDENPEHPGLYEWEGKKDAYVEWTGKYWLIIQGKNRFIYTEAMARWRGLAEDLTWVAAKPLPELIDDLLDLT